MIVSKLHNDLFVKKVEDITTLFKWGNVLTHDFPQLPINSIVLDDVLVKQYGGFHDEAFLHHSTIARKYGKVYCAYSIHDYDEDASGLHVGLATSIDGGVTWNNEIIVPQMSDMLSHGSFPAQWCYPSLFLDLPSGFYLLVNGVDGLTNVTTYNPLGTLVRKINSDGTLGNLQWVNNSVNEIDRTPPTPISGYPSYNFASETLINEVTSYIKQKMYRPKILFGWSEVWNTTSIYSGDGNILSEPTEITPYNYPKQQSLHFWKSNTIDYNIIQDTDDESTQTTSEIPIAKGSPVMRLYNYSPEIIVFVCPSLKANREELMLCIARKNNKTGRYEIANNDAYSLSANIKNTPVYSGFNKGGGLQLPFINRVGKNKLDVAFSVTKEEIYFKTIDVSKLI